MELVLTEGQLDALRNLGRKSGGDVTAFVNISDCQHLTELGFASRSRQGWDITTGGSAYLARLDAGGWRNDPLVRDPDER
ncbi:MAG: hypothetical protein KKE02_10535 [Alphaproteobacteria bacterium]|nr:hypothetical protein [Alphaproteobacteria bacterium]MBU1515871.1 hypothetical protein [Alphaproteobacteria bacterium]MBU2094093.1 hypothetical protein [Alphaproteobacteria bacterium]MBU2151445.1 hypothetical protein [Alphaproteobacteria bacterium]MBU2305279.1 hypothetical protein [Alphaproteobacteria bacterium]